METINDFLSNNISNISFLSDSENDTLNFAKEIANKLKGNEIIVLNGELGSGKTVFMKGIADFFNIKNDVSSPTFTIVNEYDTPKFKIFHFDVYRIKNSAEFENSIGTDYFQLGVCIIEWGEIIEDILPLNSIIIDIEKIDENKRKFNLRRNF